MLNGYSLVFINWDYIEKIENMKNNPAIQQQLNTLYEILAMVNRISKRELPEGSVTNPGWTQFEYGKDHAYETIIFNLQERIDKLKQKEEEWQESMSHKQQNTT